MGGTIGTITASQRSCTVRAIVPIFVQYSNESIRSMSGCVNQHRFSTLIDTASTASSGNLARMESHSRNVRNSIPPSPPFQDEVAERAVRGRRVEPEQRVCEAQRNGQPKAGLEEMRRSLTNPSLSATFSKFRTNETASEF